MERAEIEEMFASLGEVTIRRMFGGKGVYHHGRIIAVEIGGELRLKADAVSAPAFEAAGARRWTYEIRTGEGKAGEGRAGRPAQMPYWSIPDAAFDDPDLMAGWVRLAYDAALRAPAKRR